jgi:hypothetical protein
VDELPLFTSLERDVTAFPSGTDNYKHHPARRGAEPIVRLNETEGRWSEDEPPMILGYSLAEHRCGYKCLREEEPCFGPHCYCSGAEHGVDEDALCLPLHLCYAACEQLAGCFGVTALVGALRCTLAASAAVAQDDEHDFFERRSGLACTDVSDFGTLYSTLIVTNRVHLRRGDWVIGTGTRRPEPKCRDDPVEDDLSDLSFSLEITGRGLDWRRDRMTLLDCGVACGDPDSIPTDVIVKPAYHGVPNPSWEVWNVFHAYTSFIDRPADDNERIPFDFTRAKTYGTLSGVYCPGRNYDRITLGYHADQLCYKKCIVEAPCEGDDCFCEGLNEGQDGLDSEALCLSEARCRATCDRLGKGCVGVDMHSERPRCYLNMAGWDEEDELQFADAAEGWGRCEYGVVAHHLAHDPEYKYVFHYNQDVKNFIFDMNENERPAFTLNRMLADEPRARRLEIKSDVREHCYAANEDDLGYSWGKLLRFKPIQLDSGGRFRMCFCDHTLTEKGECQRPEHYSLDLGYVHASGVSCFMDQDRFDRERHCVSQFHGGQRCYSAPEFEPVVGEPQDQIVTPAWDDADIQKDDDDSNLN